MKKALVSIQNMRLMHEFEHDVQERGQMILEHFDELSAELIMK